MAEDISKPAVDAVLQFTREFPKPPAGKGVRGDAVLAALRRVEPLAAKIAALAEGTKKGAFSGGGYLTGSNVVTADDKQVAGRVLYEIRERLPKYGTNPLEPWLLEQIKATTQRLLMIGTDLVVEQTLMDKASLAWESTKDAIVDLPETLRAAAEAATRAAGKLAGNVAGGALSGMGLGPGTVALGGLALVAVLLLAGRR